MTAHSRSTHAADLDLALRLADAADAISLPRFGAADLRVTAKPDLTPVSDADLAVETAVRDLLAAERPDDDVIGEEFGGAAGPQLDGASGRRWVIDPIDGTKNLAGGVPIRASLMALQSTAIKWSSAWCPRRPWPAAGGPATAAERSPASRVPIRSRAAFPARVRIARRPLTYSGPAGMEDDGRGEQFSGLLKTCWRTRGYGDFLPYMLVAEGAADIAAEPELSLWDLAALVPVVTEAGGCFTDVDGATVALQR